MITYIALLRGINVSGQKKIRMVELKNYMSEWGFVNVRTYIQSGNLVFEYGKAANIEIEAKIRSGIQESFGFDVGVWVRNFTDFQSIVELNPFSGEDKTAQLYFVFLNQPANVELAGQLGKESFENEEFRIYKDCIFLNCQSGYGKAKCNNNFFEKRLKVQATTRNLRTVQKLLEMATG